MKKAITIFLVLISINLYSQNENEPNNTFSQANPISSGDTKQGLICQQGDEDYYSINITEPGMIKLEILTVPSDINMSLWIYAPDQQTVINQDLGADGQAFSLEVSTCELGDHFFYFKDAFGNDFNCSEQYQFTVDFVPFSLVDPCECNGGFSTACDINSGDTVSAVIAPWFDDNNIIEDKDYYKISITEPGMMKLTVFGVPSNINLVSYIYAPNQQTVINDISGGDGQGFVQEVSTCEVGDHFFYFWASGNDFNSSEQYQFKVDFVPFSLVDNCECNNSFNDACQIGVCDTIFAVIAPWFDDNNIIVDKDLYKIELSSSEEVSIEILSVPANVRMCVKIYDSPSSQIDNYSGNIGQALNFNYTAPNDEIYYFELTDCSGNFNSESQYELRIGCNLINSTKDLDLIKVVTVSPNPFSESFSIDFKGFVGQEHEITLFDVLGNSVFTQKNIEVGNFPINTENIPKGVYVLRLRIGSIYYSTKLMKI